MKTKTTAHRKSKQFEWKPFSKKQLKVTTWWCDPSPYKDYDGIHPSQIPNYKWAKDIFGLKPLSEL